MLAIAFNSLKPVTKDTTRKVTKEKNYPGTRVGPGGLLRKREKERYILTMALYACEKLWWNLIPNINLGSKC